MPRLVASLTFLFLCAASTFAAEEWAKLPSIPDREGLAGSFAGVSNGALIFAGGANFPEKKPWEGGQKIWHDEVYVLEKPNGSWITAGRLPRKLAYGVSVTFRDSILCIGGSDYERHYAEAFRLTWREGRLTTTPLPPLPKPLANGCGALVGDHLYVGGGQTSPTTTSALGRFWSLDLSAAKPQWQEIAPMPGKGRILATAAAWGEKFWVLGGAELVAGQDGKVERIYLRDAWSFDTRKKEWKSIADLPVAAVAAPSPAPADASGLYLLGGDDGSQLAAAPTEHRGFPKPIFRYDPQTDRWSKRGEMPAPRVTVPCVRWNDAWVISSGEQRPGVRSPEVWSWK